MYKVKIIFADGLAVRVDDDLHESLKDFVWHVRRRTEHCVYAYRYRKDQSGAFHRVIMHREIMGFPELSVDHINGDTLDNRRSNLRLATQTQQAQNFRRRNGKRFKGVTHCPLIHHRFKCRVPWRARIRVNGKLISLGFYATEEEAALAYNKAAKKHFGEFAALNEVGA